MVYKKGNSKIMSRIKMPGSMFLRPDIIIGSTVILGFLLLIFSILEIQSTRKELMHTLGEQGHAIMASVQKGVKNADESFSLVENSLAEKLLSSARLIERLDYANMLSDSSLVHIARENSIFRINIYDKDGKRVLTNQLSAARGNVNAPHQLLKSILKKGNEELVLGFRQGRFGSGQRFAVAKRRRKGGVIVLNINATDMLEFRRTIGAGKLLQDIGDTDGVDYVVFQDSTGILLASAGVDSMTAITTDEFLQYAIQSKNAMTRLTPFTDKDVFEIVQSVYTEDQFDGLLRIGLPIQHLREAEKNSRDRVLVVSLLLLVVGVVVANGVIGRQNYHNLQNAYNRIETYTGDILANMTDAVVAVNRDGKITVFNRVAEELFRVNTGDAVMQACEMVTPALCPVMQTALLTGESVQDAEMTMSINQKEYILSVNTSFLYDSENEIDTAIAVIKDLTRQKRMEDNLKRKDQLTAMGHLASGVAHEVRNPLNAISMIAQRFELEFKPEHDVEEYQKLTSTMVRETKRINGIIQQFLQFARPSELQLQKTNMSALIDRVATLMKPVAADKSIILEIRCENAPDVFADKGKLEQALVNLIQNSIQASHEGQSILITCVHENEYIKIDIIDSGKGIPEDQLGKIFNLYFTTRKSGTGIGLSLVQQIISQHNGTIEVKSGKGKGTQFTILLPNKE